MNPPPTAFLQQSFIDYYWVSDLLLGNGDFFKNVRLSFKELKTSQKGQTQTEAIILK